MDFIYLCIAYTHAPQRNMEYNDISRENKPNSFAVSLLTHMVFVWMCEEVSIDQ